MYRHLNLPKVVEADIGHICRRTADFLKTAVAKLGCIILKLGTVERKCLLAVGTVFLKGIEERHCAVFVVIHGIYHECACLGAIIRRVDILHLLSRVRRRVLVVV